MDRPEDAPESTLVTAHRLTSSVETITPEQAQRYLSHYMYDRQRPLRVTQVEVYEGAMRAGTMDPSEIIIGFVDGEARPYVLDGQHRFSALVRFGQAYQFPVTRRYFRNHEEMAEAYARINRGLSRSTLDIVRAFDLVSEIGVPDHMISRFAPGALYAAAGMSEFRERYRTLARSGESRVRAMREFAREARLYYELMDAPKRDIMALSSVGSTAFALTILRYAEEDAKRFIASLMSQDGLHRSSPEYGLMVWLRDQRSQIVGIGYIARGWASAWNAWTEGRTLNRIVPQNTNQPIRVNLTPLDGRETVALPWAKDLLSGLRKGK